MRLEEPLAHAAFGQNVRLARRQSRLKQTDLASRSGLSQQVISVIEKGDHNLTLRTMLRLARALNTDLQTLLANVDEQRDQQAGTNAATG